MEIRRKTLSEKKKLEQIDYKLYIQIYKMDRKSPECDELFDQNKKLKPFHTFTSIIYVNRFNV